MYSMCNISLMQPWPRFHTAVPRILVSVLALTATWLIADNFTSSCCIVLSCCSILLQRAVARTEMVTHRSTLSAMHCHGSQLLASHELPRGLLLVRSSPLGSSRDASNCAIQCWARLASTGTATWSSQIGSSETDTRDTAISDDKVVEVTRPTHSVLLTDISDPSTFKYTQETGDWQVVPTVPVMATSIIQLETCLLLARWLIYAT